MVRKLLFYFIISLCILGTQAAAYQTQALEKQLQREIATSQIHQTAPRTVATATAPYSKAAIEQALRKVTLTNFTGENHALLFWETVLSRMQKYTSFLEHKQEIFITGKSYRHFSLPDKPFDITNPEPTWGELISQYTLTDFQELNDTFLNKIYDLLTSRALARPDYGTETKGFNYIYLADASSHDTYSIVQEVGNVLQSVRKTNPKAKILLALEFASRLDLTALPIRFAHQSNPNIDIDNPYDMLLAQADQLNMDILALDDVWVTGVKDDPKNSIIFPLGHLEPGIGLLVYITPQNVANLNKSAVSAPISHEQLSHIRMFSSISDFGSTTRNTQWADYIKAVKPFYDIVIVYAGSGHLDSLLAPESLPEKIGEDHVLFNFYTAEKLPQELQKAYEKEYQTVCQYGGAATFSLIDPTIWVCDNNSPTWDEKSFLYERFDGSQTGKQLLQKTLSKQEYANYQKYNKMVLQSGVVNKKYFQSQQISFDVYIPDLRQ